MCVRTLLFEALHRCDERRSGRPDQPTAHRTPTHHQHASQHPPLTCPRGQWCQCHSTAAAAHRTSSAGGSSRSPAAFGRIFPLLSVRATHQWSCTAHASAMLRAGVRAGEKESAPTDHTCDGRAVHCHGRESTNALNLASQAVLDLFDGHRERELHRGDLAQALVLNKHRSHPHTQIY